MTAARDLGAISRAYASCPPAIRMRVLGRYVLCPFASLLRAFPQTGRILDIGCGDGLLLFLLSREQNSHARSYVGIDVDRRKIAYATRAAVANAEFRMQDISTVPPEEFDCVSIIDVLYLLPRERWSRFLEQSVRALKTGGLLVVKEVADRPRWKYWIGYLEEVVAIKVLGMTTGDTPHLEPIDVYRSAIAAAGAEVFHVERVDARRPHAHVLLLAKKR